ncbi:MAG: hypothetical protein SP4CHLAM5_09750 [Chlamydiia bacterium]|nr:hypothetical protein [Chlamydiia bacterium]MCH9618833.1 hypothetical protein [Chlamydiia bacterium]MCH9624365.1 hypothetical protein [Chlamydiia bacterium]
MNNLKNIDSIPDPSKRKGENDAVNPDKFQKALKVEKSEETEKREKRNRPKKEEELEDEVDDTGASIPIPTGLFKEYMTEDDKKVSILDASAGSKPHMVADSNAATAAPLGYIPEAKKGTPASKLSVGVTDNTPSTANLADDDDDLLSAPPTGLESDDNEENITSNAPLPQQAPSPTPPQQNINQNAPTAPLEGDQEEVDQTGNTTENTSTSPSKPQPQTEASKKKKTKKVTKKKATKTTEKEAKTVKTKGKKAKSTGPAQKTVKEKGVSQTKEKRGKTGKVGAQKAPKKEAPVKEDKNVPVEATKNAHRKRVNESSPVKEKEDKSDDDMPISAAKAPADTGHDHKDDSSHKESDDQEIVGVGAPEAPSITGVDALQMSPFANIPKDVFELFEKMVGMMQVSKDNGKSITTVKLNMPGSTFDKCELVLEHYDTAPNNYNVQFLGNPDAVNRFTQNLAGLDGVIKNSKLNFSIHLLPPKLNKNYTSAVSGIEKEKGDKEEKDGDESDN